MTFAAFTGWAVLVFYSGAAVFGIGIGLVAVGMPRYFPVVTMMGLGMGAPAVTLAIIRSIRLLGLPPGPEWANSVALLASFAMLLGLWTAASVVMVREHRQDRLERRERQLAGC